MPEVIVEHGSGTTRYLHLPHSTATDDGAWTYSAADGLGSVRQRLDASGQVAAVNDYRPFGAPLDSGGGDPYGFTGEWWEGDAGLLFLRARYYDAATGRFLSQDPFAGYVGLSQTQNKYIYVVDRPTRFIDPTGLDWQNPTTDEGIAIHTMIETRYLAMARASGRIAGAEVVIPFANKQSDVTMLYWLARNLCLRMARDPEATLPFGKADILDYTLREVYEIKHYPSWVVGKADAIWYADALNRLPDPIRGALRFDPPNWTPGVSYSTVPQYIGLWPTDPEAEVWAERADWGVIAYWGKKKGQEPRRQPELEPVPVLDRNPLPERKDQRHLQPAPAPIPVGSPSLWKRLEGGAQTLWGVVSGGAGLLVMGGTLVEDLVPVGGGAINDPVTLGIGGGIVGYGALNVNEGLRKLFTGQ